MTSQYLEFINQVLDETTPPSKEKLLSLMDETFSFFQGIKIRLESKDPKEREAALKETLELKDALESKMLTLSEKIGINPDQLAAFAQNSNFLSPDEQDVIEKVKSKFHGLEGNEPSNNKKHPLMNKKY